jgi:chromosome segregation protein
MDAARGRLTEIRQALGQKTDDLRALEQQRSRWIAQTTEARVLAADQRRAVEHLDQRRAAQDSRIAELEAFVRERAQGLSSSQSRIEELHRDIAAAKDQVEPLEQEIRLHQDALDALRAQREERERERQERDAALRSWRSQLDAVRQERSQVDVTLAEQRMRRQNVVDRAAGDYHVSDEDIRRAPAPDWGEEGAPADDEALETRVAEFRARLESMGPVNLVAIEEYQELEKRHEFLAQQQGDLVRSKQQLTDLIRRINKTTTELFSETFNKVNAHFEEMFAKLFGGGTAKLVLVDEGDVLESGIEIIARPPGKKLQTVSLLSGGERTMTAVALLFALYLVKPSPFCVLDELDAALDDSNIGRFVKVVQDFLEKSQFVVITHNRQTIAAAHALFGVTMQRQGVSRIVSVRFNAEGRPEPDAAEETAAAEATVGPSPALADEAVPAAPEPAAPA